MHVRTGRQFTHPQCAEAGGGRVRKMRNRTVNGTGALRPHAFAPIPSERDRCKISRFGRT